MCTPLLYVIILSVCCVQAAAPKNSAEARSTVVLDELTAALKEPVYAHPQHISYFFTHQFQHSSYPRVILPACLDHITQLLAYAPLAQDAPEYVETILHLFTQRIRSAPWIDPLALVLFLEKAEPHMHACMRARTGDAFTQQLADMLSQRLHTFIDQTFAHPNPRASYVNTPYMRAWQETERWSLQVAQEMAQQMRHVQDQSQALAYAWTMLLETAISRLIWSPSASTDSWRATCALAAQLVTLWEQDTLVNSAALNDLLWALVTRYGYFCELMYDDLTPELLTCLHEYVHTTEPTWLTIAEKDPLMLSKRDYLKNLLFELAVEKELALSAPAPQTFTHTI